MLCPFCKTVEMEEQLDLSPVELEKTAEGFEGVAMQCPQCHARQCRFRPTDAPPSLEKDAIPDAEFEENES